MSIDLENGFEGRIGVTGQAVKSRQPQLVNNVGECSFYLQQRLQTSSELAVPIMAAGEVIGVINIEHNARDAFDQDDQKILESLAAQASIAITNARQFERLKETERKIRVSMTLGSMAARGHAAGKLARGLQQEVDELERVLGEPVLNERVSRLVASIRCFAGEILMVADSDHRVMEAIPVNEFLRKRANELWKLALYAGIPAPDISRVATPSTVVHANPTLLRAALDHFFENAKDAMVHSKEKKLTIETEIVGANVRIKFMDTGCGIPADVLDDLRDQVPVSRPNGSGIGLLIARAIIEFYGGDLVFDSSSPTGTTVVIRLPIQPAT